MVLLVVLLVLLVVLLALVVVLVEKTERADEIPHFLTRVKGVYCIVTFSYVLGVNENPPLTHPPNLP